MRSFSTAIFSLIAYQGLCECRLITQDELLDSYDYVIAGGGTAGMALGNRLSEAPSSSLSRSLYACLAQLIQKCNSHGPRD